MGKAGIKLQPAKEGEVSEQKPNPWGLGTFVKIPVSNLALMLTAYLRQPVVDHTGLTGSFDFKLDLTPETDGPKSLDNLRDAVLRAVPEQLGVKLERQNVPIEEIVIDRAERPNAN
jgi:uncharacterized protein (TIGR03435 family)